MRSSDICRCVGPADLAELQDLLTKRNARRADRVERERLAALQPEAPRSLFRTDDYWLARTRAPLLRPVFSYSDNYLIDTDHSVFVDVEAIADCFLGEPVGSFMAFGLLSGPLGVEPHRADRRPATRASGPVFMPGSMLQSVEPRLCEQASLLAVMALLGRHLGASGSPVA